MLYRLQQTSAAEAMLKIDAANVPKWWCVGY